MSTMTRSRRAPRPGVLTSAAALALLLTVPGVQATSTYLNTWSSLYPSSTSDDNAGCQLCHGLSTSNVNPYGFALAQCNGASGSITQRIQNAEGLNSDGDAGGASNLAETNAGAQPGWTTGAVPVWGRTSCASAGTNTASTAFAPLDPAAAVEICDNGIDDDGDGQVDCADAQCDGFTGSATACGVGACASSGNLVCQNGGQVDSCSPGAPSAEGPFGDVSCSDGSDNDCDGLTDASDPDCAAPAETCDDGVDNNGNGLTDCADPQCDNFVYATTSCGVGACAASGQDMCQTPDRVDSCTPGTPTAEGPFGSASCSDGSDNDCDGLTDVADPDCAAPAETCNDGVDNNGNGLVDCADPQCDGFTDGACATGQPGICAAGTSVCQNGAEACVQNQPAGTEGPAGSASCTDGLDNDCDGTTDAGDTDCQVPVGEICDNGIDDDGNGQTDCADTACDGYVGQPGSCATGLPGVCAGGSTACRGGQAFCDQDQQAGSEGPFGDVSCSDGLDNDCDGTADAADPDCSAPPEVCDNGVDDNGDGLVDCEDPQCDGLTFGACATGSAGVCAAGTLTCDGSGVAPACVQDQAAGTEGPAGSASCADGLDNDCDGTTDGDDSGCQTPVGETCDNGVDDDGNGLADCADPQCDGFTDGACDTGVPGVCAAGTQVCQNGGQVCVQDQAAGTEGPVGSPTCGDGLDNDCDGLADAADPDCAAGGTGDVYLSTLRAPRYLGARVGRVARGPLVAVGDGTDVTQDATVTVTATASPGIAVVVEPASVTAEVVPGGRPTVFRGFTAFVTCEQATRGSVEWTATIAAPANADASNDVQTATTAVMCGGRKHGAERDDD